MASSPLTTRAPIPPELRQALRERLEQGQIDLPLLPAVVYDVLAETDSERGDMRRLADIIRRDAAMAGHVLRVANSPLFLPAAPIVSLQQAISRLGLEAIRRIAVLVACQTRIFQVRGHEIAVQLLFRHSLAAAAYAQEIARTRRNNVEEAFLAGLLHDVGRPVLLQAVADLAAETGARIEPAVAHGLVGELHEEAGSALVRHWRLPEWLSETVRRHHDPVISPTSALPAVTALADMLAHELLASRPVDVAACRRHPLWAPLNIYPDQVEAILGHRPHIAGLVGSLS